MSDAFNALMGISPLLGILTASEKAEAAPLGTLAKTLGKKTRKAYHGSPHDFDKFSLTKIGTGEGAQAYGHGLYFSSSEDIAKFYRDSLTGYHARFVKDGVYSSRAEAYRGVVDAISNPDLPEDKAKSIADAVIQGKLDGDDADHMRRFVQKSDWDLPEKEAWLKALDQADEYLLEIDEGKLYTVEIPDESNMLDWDKPLSEQPENVKAALRKSGLYADDSGMDDFIAWFNDPNAPGKTQFEKEITENAGRWEDLPEKKKRLFAGLLETRQVKGMDRPNPEMTGKEFYDSLDIVGSSRADPAHVYAAKDMRAHGYTEEQAVAALESAYPDADNIELRAAWQESFPGGPKGYVSNKLRELGIPGITYKGATSDERNFVVFDDAMTNIMEKGFADPALLALLGTGAAGSVAALRAFAGDRPMPGQYSIMDALKGAPDAAMDAFAGMVSPTLTAFPKVVDYLSGYTADQMERRNAAREEKLNYEPRTRMGRDLSEAGQRGLESLIQGMMSTPVGAMQHPMGMPIMSALEAFQGMPTRERMALEGLIDTMDVVTPW